MKTIKQILYDICVSIEIRYNENEKNELFFNLDATHRSDVDLD